MFLFQFHADHQIWPEIRDQASIRMKRGLPLTLRPVSGKALMHPSPKELFIKMEGEDSQRFSIYDLRFTISWVW